MLSFFNGHIAYNMLDVKAEVGSRESNKQNQQSAAVSTEREWSKKEERRDER